MAVILDIGLLRTFIVISEEGCFTAAANRVLRSQSAISQQMHRLEEAVGHPLFVKEGRPRVLTQHGHNLLHFAEQIVSLNDHALATLGASQESGAVRLGTPHDIADSILPFVLSRFAKAYPNMHVVLTVDRSPNLMPLLQDGKLDVTLTTRHSERFEGRLLRSSPAVWIGRVGTKLDPLRPVPLVLVDEPSIYRRMALTALDQRGVPWVERYTCPNISSIQVALSAGLGITARTPEMLTPDLRIYGEEDGLPPLPNVNFYVYRAYGEIGEAALYLYDLLCSA
ncbi:MAG: LysR substrate-binding domain-containing protein [Kiloniellaceae bacterium]